MTTDAAHTNTHPHAAGCWSARRREVTGGGNVATFNLAANALTRYAHDRARLALIWEATNGRRETFTFFDLERLSNRIANALDALGLKRQDRIFTLLKRTPALYAALPAALKLGAAVGVLFTDFGPEAIRQRLADAGARLVLTDTRHLPKLLSVCGTLPSLEHILVADAGDEARAAIREAQAIAGNCPDVRVHDLETLLERASPAFTPVAVDADETCFFVYTSGTTGLPKGVVHRHAIEERLVATAGEVLALEDSDLYWCTADPGWVTGLCYGVFAPWLMGCPVFVYEGEFEAARWLDLLERHQITCWYMTPTLLRLLMRACGEELTDQRDFALRRIYSVGEPLTAEVIEWAERTFGVPVYDNYWQTETGSLVIANRPGVPVRRGSMGKPVTGVAAAIIDEHGQELPAGMIGDIAIRPTLSSLFKGYWNFPEATRACFRAGWYITRDRGRLDHEGYFWFVARDDDVITCEAQRVGPFEVETALLAHPAVAEAAVIGVPDQVTTERVKAYIILHDAYTSARELAEEIAAYVRAQLSPVACPREIEFCDNLPRTRTGKIQRALLREQHEQQRSERAFSLE